MAQHKQHYNPDTGSVGLCRAKDSSNCPLVREFGDEAKHFDTKEEALSYQEDMARQDAVKEGNVLGTQSKVYENTKTSELKNKNKSFREIFHENNFEKLMKSTPVVFDSENYNLYQQEANSENTVDRLQKSIANYHDLVQSHGADSYSGKSYMQKIQKSRELLDQEQKALDEVREKINVYQEIYEKRGSWPRAYLVRNMNGHVHSSRNCSTCNKGDSKTDFSWQTKFSGKTEQEIIDAAGWRACDVCYPTIQGQDRSKLPTEMFTEEEEKREIARQARASKKAEKEAKTKAEAVSAPDGGPLVLQDTYRPIHVKNERQAVSLGRDALVTEKKWNYYDKNPQKMNESHYEEEMKNLKILVEALARKRGDTEENVLKDLQVRADKEWKKYEKSGWIK